MESTQNIQQRSTTSLRPHPQNQTLYEKVDPSSAAFTQLMESIKTNGILQPLVIRPDGTILSGHRRHQAATKLGIESVPVTIVEGGDDRLLIVEYNRYRQKTVSETMREAELVMVVLREEAEARQFRHRGATRDTKVDPETKGKVTEFASETVGMKTRTFEKAKAIYEAARTNENAKDKLAKVDAGELSINAAYKAIRKLTESSVGTDIPDIIRFYTCWQFVENDPRFGQPHPGRIPGQIPANIIYYFTEPGDLVVDPMAGGGSTIDAAEFLGRRCLGYDVVPRRTDIIQHDISKGFPAEAREAQLIFMDPPYWNMKDEGYSDASSSRFSLEDFRAWYRKLLFDAANTVRRGGFVALIIMNQYYRLPDDFPHGYIDWGFETYKNLHDAGMAPWSRVAVTQPTSQYTGFDVDAAKKGKFMLPNLADIIIMRRVI